MLSILMATYNGENFLSQQIDSLLSQTFSDFTIHVQDDASTDKTWEILTAYKNRFPDKIKISQRKKNSGDAKHNFLDLISAVQDDYLMLCDQDDVWLPEKIEITLSKMKEMEQKYSSATPILVHTDLKVADSGLNIINPSYRRATVRNYERTAINQVLTLNNASGCTIMYNRALAEVLTEKPEFCVVHDWWLQIVAAYFGKIGHVDKSTVMYRQHGENSIGAKDTRKLSYKLRQLLNSSHIKNRINDTYPQAESLLGLYRKKTCPGTNYIIGKFYRNASLGEICSVAHYLQK